MSFQNLVRLSQIKKIPCLSKKVEKIAITVIQLDEILLYLRPFYNGAFSIASKNDIDFCVKIDRDVKSLIITEL
jgi:hypothetical protein